MRLRHLRFVALLLALFALLGLAAGCSDDDDGDGGSASGSAAESDDGEDATGNGGGDGATESTVKPGDQVGQELTAQRQGYCEQWNATLAVQREAFNDADPNAVKAHYNKVVPLAEELERRSPDDVKSYVTKLVGFLRGIAAAGDEDAVDKEANSQNGAFLKNYAERWCDAAS